MSYVEHITITLFQTAEQSLVISKRHPSSFMYFLFSHLKVFLIAEKKNLFYVLSGYHLSLRNTR